MKNSATSAGISIFAALVLLTLRTVSANEPFPYDQHPDLVPGVDPEPAIEIHVTLSDKVALGQTDNGERFIVPITGGEFTGRNVQGVVVPGGADWQLVRSDNVKEYVARYSLRTDDGYTIMVDNRGISRDAEGGLYRVTVPEFHAPQGPYQWLNESLFVGTITSVKKPRAVVIRAYEVR